MQTDNSNTMLNTMLEAIVAVILSMVPVDKLIDAIMGRDDDDKAQIKTALDGTAGTTPYGADDKADTAPATSAAVVDRVLTLIDTYPVADRNGKMLLVARKLVTLIGGATVSDLLTKEEIVEAAECAGLAMEGDDALDVCRKSMDSGDRTPEEFANVALEYDADAVVEEVHGHQGDALLELFQPSDVVDHFCHDELRGCMDADETKQWLRDNGYGADVDIDTIRSAAEELVEYAQSLVNTVDEYS